MFISHLLDSDSVAGAPREWRAGHLMKDQKAPESMGEGSAPDVG